MQEIMQKTIKESLSKSIKTKSLYGLWMTIFLYVATVGVGVFARVTLGGKERFDLDRRGDSGDPGEENREAEFQMPATPPPASPGVSDDLLPPLKPLDDY